MRSVAIVVLCLAACAAGCSAPSSTPQGEWNGAIDAAGTAVHVGLVLTEADSEPSGSAPPAGYQGRISFPQEGSFGLVVANLQVDGNRISFRIPETQGDPRFEGVFEGVEMEGTFTQGGRSFPFALRKGAPAVAAVVLTDAVRRSVVDRAAEALERGYIYEDVGQQLGDAIRERVTGERYAALEAPADFTDALREDLVAVAGDIHLRVEYHPAAPESSESSESPAAEGPRTPANEPLASGLGRSELLPGDVGYLEMLHFGGGEDAARELDARLRELEPARALIIDLRKNLGGGPYMVRYLSTVLFDRPTHLASRIARDLPEPAERWTFESVPAPRFADIPVMVLISGTTVSAGESFAFGLRNTERALLVGQRTAGGGHFGDLVDVGHDFWLFLPQGKTVHPTTLEGWEATGLEPDIEAPVDDALAAALAALEPNPSSS